MDITAHCMMLTSSTFIVFDKIVSPTCDLSLIIISFSAECMMLTLLVFH